MVREGHGLSYLAQLLEILGNNNIDVFGNIHKGLISFSIANQSITFLASDCAFHDKIGRLLPL